MKRSLATRLASWLLLRMARTLWGLPVALMPVIVDQLGPLGALRWMAKNLPGYERMLKDMGPLRGHLASTFVSMLNGCYYCAFAHARAFQLHHYRARDTLFPLDEHQLVDLVALPDSEALGRLEEAFQAAQMPEELRLYRRLLDLKYHGATPSTAEDAHLMHAIRMFEVLNFCGISRAVPLDGAHDPINKDAGLKLRYAQARLASRRDPEQPPAAAPTGARASGEG